MQALLLFQCVALHAWFSPYTKVEESFNVQATHDLLFHPTAVFNQTEVQLHFDHVQFPGVVPRTFWGGLIVSTLARPMVGLVPLEHYLFICRLAVGLLFTIASMAMSQQVPTSTGKWFFVLLMCQFHVPFYSTRMLPNTFAMLLIMFSQALLLCGGRDKLAIGLQILCVVVFRCDMILLLAPTALYVWIQANYKHNSTLWEWWVSGWKLFGFGVVCVLASLSLTVGLDYGMWLGEHVWPEGQVLYYNTWLNKSSNWGTSPWYWYWIVGLPKSLLLSLPLMVIGALQADSKLIQAIFLPTLCFVGLYSLLPHKEIRFLFPILPGLTLCAAKGADWLWKQNILGIKLVLVAGLLISLLAVVGFSAVSSHNYPGGYATKWLVQNRKSQGLVHIDAYSAMNGISRFSQLGSMLEFDKTEGDIANWSRYDYLVSHAKEDFTARGFTPVHVETGEPAWKGTRIQTQPVVRVWEQNSGK
ncbi:hypothetical protein BASA81_014033 [Batrachochytrium salamandrivorans]|nr:hypothetical protein BASA81_014033 [Batrachochytrium salamandrivorans]